MISAERRHFLRTLLTIALPIAMQEMITIVVNLIDNVMIGQLGEFAISGVSYTTQFVFLFSTLCSGLTSGAVVIGTQAWGAGDSGKVKRLFKLVMYISLTLGCVLVAAALAVPRQILRIYTADVDVVRVALPYFRIIMLSMLPSFVSRTIQSFLRITKNVKFGMYNSILCCFVNMLLNWVLIYGNLGAPRLGVRGAALATLAARIVELLVSAIYFFRAEKQIAFRLADFRLPACDMLRPLLLIGLPLLGSEVVNSLNSTIQAVIMGRGAGTEFAAANSLVHNSYQIMQVLARGFGSAAMILLGLSIATDSREAVQRQANAFLHLAWVVGILSGLFVIVAVPILGKFYTLTDETRAIAREISYAASITVCCVSLQEIVARGVIKAGGRTAVQMRADLICSWLIGVPVALVIVFVCKAAPFWIYLSIRAAYIAKATWGIWFVKRKDWYVKIT